MREYEIEKQKEVKTIYNPHENDFEKLDFDMLHFEITRRCNLACSHCFRGEAQNIDMTREVIDRAFNNIRSVKSIAITGGEPMLATEQIEYLTDKIIALDMPLLECSMVVNGTILDERAERFITALNRLGSYLAMKNKVIAEKMADALSIPVDKIPFIHIIISDDNYHDNDYKKALKYYQSLSNKHIRVSLNCEDSIKKYTVDQKGLPEYYVMCEKDVTDTDMLKDVRNNINLVYEGRAADNPTLAKDAKYKSGHYMIEYDNNHIITDLQVSANGLICIKRSMSFKREDDIAIGNIIDNRSVKAMIYDWNWKNPLSKKEVKQSLEAQKTIDDGIVTDNQREILEYLIKCISANRNLIHSIHETYPYIGFDDAIRISDIMLDIRTSGLFSEAVEGKEYLKNIYDNVKREHIEPDTISGLNILGMRKAGLSDWQILTNIV